MGIGISISLASLSVSASLRYRYTDSVVNSHNPLLGNTGARKMLLGFFCWDNLVYMLLFPNSGSYRVLVVFQRTGEFQESPQDFSAAGTGQAIAPPKPPEDEK